MFRTLDQADVKGKRVLVRVDLNVPIENGKVTDTTRIERVAPTIREIADKGGKVILLSHFGRPKGLDPKESLGLFAPAIADVLGRPVAFADGLHRREGRRPPIGAMKPGDILCLENTRFHKGEEKNDPAFVAELAKLGDIFVNDAFSVAHRAHASTEGLGRKLPDLCRPHHAGRARRADQGAGDADAAARGHRRRRQGLDQARPARQPARQGRRAGHRRRHGQYLSGRARARRRKIAVRARSRCRPRARSWTMAKAKGREIVLPVDAVVAKTFEANAPSRVVAVDGVGADEMILDIGPRSIEHVCSVLARVKTLVWNGPFGAFELEPFDNGTVEVAEAAAELTAAGKLVTVAGGGDTVAALNSAGVTERFTYVSTAGGAFLEWLEGKALPGVEIMRVR